MKYVLLFLLVWSIKLKAQENPTMEFPGEKVEGKIPNPKDQHPKNRPGGKDEPSDKKTPNTANSSSNIYDIAISYVSKYGSTASELYKNELKLNPLLLTSFQKSALSIGSKAVMVLDIGSTINDLKDGKWGSLVCFGIGLSPFPYGTIGSLLCNNSLTVIRLINESKK